MAKRLPTTHAAPAELKELSTIQEPQPCPFCGSEPVLIKSTFPSGDYNIYLKCSGIHCGAQIDAEASRQEEWATYIAIERWNRRVTPVEQKPRAYISPAMFQVLDTLDTIGKDRQKRRILHRVQFGKTEEVSICTYSDLADNYRFEPVKLQTLRALETRGFIKKTNRLGTGKPIPIDMK